MKAFLKYTAATVTGIILVAVIATIIGVVSILGMIASSTSEAAIDNSSVFVLRLSGTLQERAGGDILSQLTGGNAEALGLQEITSAIAKAKNNDKIKGIYIEVGVFAPDAPASSQALRKSLADFKKSGKWIVSYADAYTQSAYYICSVADKVYINPEGSLDWHGLGGTTVFLKDFMAKFGVKMQLSKVGKYKSAPEMYTADKMSDANREQTQAYIDGVWQTMLDDVSASRKVSKADLNAFADSLAFFAPAEEYKRRKLVDGLLYTDQVRDEVKKRLGIDLNDKEEEINQVTLAEVSTLNSKSDGDKIAVYYAYGDIVDTRPTSVTGGSYIAADEVSKDLERLSKDDDVKAVVLRVNSGGGSAYASEQIWRSVELLKKKKPIVVSMGGLAASGGYYMSCGANYIMAEPTTLTGSIGIFGMFPDFSGLLTEKLGVRFDQVTTNRNSAFGTLARPFNDEEMRVINAYVSRGYRLFLKRVADGRKLTVEKVDNIAQGRVWLAKDALKIRLIDAFGGVDDAVKKAAELAKVAKYHKEIYPEEKGLIESLWGMADRNSYLDGQLRQVLGEYYEPFLYLKTINQRSAVQARMPFDIIVR